MARRLSSGQRGRSTHAARLRRNMQGSTAGGRAPPWLVVRLHGMLAVAIRPLPPGGTRIHARSSVTVPYSSCSHYSAGAPRSPLCRHPSRHRSAHQRRAGCSCSQQARPDRGEFAAPAIADHPAAQCPAPALHLSRPHAPGAAGQPTAYLGTRAYPSSSPRPSCAGSKSAVCPKHPIATTSRPFMRQTA